jgi:hypothetical protein
MGAHQQPHAQEAKHRVDPETPSKRNDQAGCGKEDDQFA